MRLTGVAVTDSGGKDNEMWERIGGFPESLGGGLVDSGTGEKQFKIDIPNL